MVTYRDVIEFLLELGLIERLDRFDPVRWRIANDLPYAEDVLPLSAERLEDLSRLRWRLSFHDASNAIVDWLRQKRVPGAAHGEITTSLEVLSEELGLDLQDARHGLAVVVTQGEGDIIADLDPETVAETDPLVIRIDWELFDIGRTVYRATSFPDAPEE